MSRSCLDEHVVLNFALEKCDPHIDLVSAPVMLTRYSEKDALAAGTAYWCNRFAVDDTGFLNVGCSTSRALNPLSAFCLNTNFERMIFWSVGTLVMGTRSYTPCSVRLVISFSIAFCQSLRSRELMVSVQLVGVRIFAFVSSPENPV